MHQGVTDSQHDLHLELTDLSTSLEITKRGQGIRNWGLCGLGRRRGEDAAAGMGPKLEEAEHPTHHAGA